MTENIKEANELLEKLKKSLPIYAYLTKVMCSHLNNQKNIKIKPKTPLEITKVLYGGDFSGITCAVELKNKEVLAISLTYLRFNYSHPLSGEINRYRMKRLKNLSGY